MKVPLMYLLIHDRLKKKSKGLIDLEIKDVFNMFSYLHHIKKEYRYPVLKELEDFKLISKVSPTKISVLKSNININNTSKIYKSVGFY